MTDTTILEKFGYLVKLKLDILYDREIAPLGICPNEILPYMHQEAYTRML